MKDRYSIAKFIESRGGVVRSARELGVGAHCVRVWLRGEGTPRVRTIIKMVELSKGRLTFTSIARESTRALKGKAKI